MKKGNPRSKSTIRNPRAKSTIPASLLEVWVTYDPKKKKVVVFPDRVRLDSSDQVIRWSTDARDIRIEFDQKNPIRGGLYRRAGGTCEVSEIPMGNFGTHKYTVYLTLDNGAEVSKDPDVIVKY